MLPARVSYLEARVMLARQKEAILAKIRQFSRSHIVHRGRDIFPPGVTSVDPSTVPGLRELGWTPQMDELTRRPTRGPEFSIMQRLLTDMQNQPAAWAFARPVNKDEVRLLGAAGLTRQVLDYYNVIKEVRCSRSSRLTVAADGPRGSSPSPCFADMRRRWRASSSTDPIRCATSRHLD